MEQLKGKKLLVLAGAAVHCKVVDAAKRLGVYTIVTDYLEDSPAKRIADESWSLSILDTDAIIDKCKEEKVDGILNFCIDPAQIPYCRIAHCLNLPCYGTEEQFFIMTNKPAFKTFCEKCGLDVIPTYTESDIEAGSVEYPVLIKPADSRGSRGQSVCFSRDETKEAISLARKESTNEQVVIEKYMLGKQDFSMTYFVCDGIPYLTRTCDRYLGRIEDRLNKQCIAAIAPSKYSDFYLEKIDSKVRHFIHELGIKNGPLFMQGFIDGDTIRFYDPGLRFPGGETELFLANATGVDLMELMVEYSLTGSMNGSALRNDLYMLDGYHSIQLDFTCKAGRIAKFAGLEDLAKSPFVQSVFTRYEAGSIVPDCDDVRRRVCEVGLLVGKEVCIQDAVSDIQKMFDVIGEDGNSMLVSQLDIKELAVHPLQLLMRK